MAQPWVTHKRSHIADSTHNPRFGAGRFYTRPIRVLVDEGPTLKMLRSFLCWDISVSLFCNYEFRDWGHAVCAQGQSTSSLKKDQSSRFLDICVLGDLGVYPPLIKLDFLGTNETMLVYLFLLTGMVNYQDIKNESKIT